MLYPNIQLPMVNGAIDLSQFKRIPGGGTHDIYQLEDNPTFLLKVIRNSIGNDEATLTPRLTDLTQKYAKLYDVFGADRCLRETRSIQKIKQQNGSSDQNAIVSLVAYDNCFQSPDKFGFNTEAVETKESKLKTNAQRYHELNSILLGNDEARSPFNADEFLFFHESLKPFFRTLADDAGLREAVEEFLVKFKAYYTETDQLLDFTGRDNVVFYKDQQGAWQYKVGSVIKTETGKKANEMLAEIATNPDCVKRSFEEWTHIFFVPSWLRTLNAVAAQLGMPRIVDNIPISAKTSKHLAGMSETLEFSDRAVRYAEENDFAKAHQLFAQHLASEKNHNTWIRHALGVLFWRDVENAETKPPREEIMKFLNLLIDEKNVFPESEWKQVQPVINGLQAQLASYGPIDNKTLEKINVALGKMGFRSEPLETILGKTLQQLTIAIAATEEIANADVSEVKPLTQLREIAKAISDAPMLEQSEKTVKATQSHVASCKQ